MKKIIYIASESHSGSTLLDMLLSTHQEVCGLGEVWMLINDAKRKAYQYSRHTCSCGTRLDQCEFWLPYIKRLDSTLTTYPLRYSFLLNQVLEEGARVLCDSSKYPMPLEALLNALCNNKALGSTVAMEDVLVLHLCKDARAYASSLVRRFGDQSPRASAIQTYLSNWLKTNKAIDELVHRYRARSVRVSYEQLCFSQDSVLRRVSKAAGLGHSAHYGELALSEGHIGLGNPMRSDPVKSKQVIYDARWFYDNDVQEIYLGMPKVVAYNCQFADSVGLSDNKSRLFSPAQNLVDVIAVEQKVQD